MIKESHMRIICALALVLMSTVCCGQTQRVAGDDAPSRISIAPDREPGDALVVTGRVFGPDGVTPLKGVSIYVYHTDINGYYSGETTNSANPRLRGHMRTDAEGRYEFKTIKPGPYPRAQVPSHIHYVVTAAGYKEKVFEIIFEGDPFINDHMRADSKNEDGTFSIRRLERDGQGVLRCVQDIKLKRQ
jgi:protocatechuate 3,4-dioxygenase beta subunit